MNSSIHKLSMDFAKVLSFCVKGDWNAALISASKLGIPRLIHVFKEKEINPNRTDPKTGKTALHYAASSSNIESVRYILSKGADTNLKDKKGRTALHHACWVEYDNFEIVKLLLDHRADPSMRDFSRKTSLHSTRLETVVKMKTIKLLLDYGKKKTL